MYRFLFKNRKMHMHGYPCGDKDTRILLPKGTDNAGMTEEVINYPDDSWAFG